MLPTLDDGVLAGGFCSYLPEDGDDGRDKGRNLAFEGGYVRQMQELDYNITWVELLEMDGVAPYTYSEELPYDDLLQQHVPGVQARSADKPILVVASLPRDDSPSAERYVAEREGETAWTMHLSDAEMASVDKVDLPIQVGAQINDREHVGAQVQVQFDPDARAWDQVGIEEDLPANYKAPSLDE